MAVECSVPNCIMCYALGLRDHYSWEEFLDMFAEAILDGSF